MLTLMGNGDSVGLMEWWQTYGMAEQSKYNTPVAFDGSSLRMESGVVGTPTQQLIGRGGEILNAGSYSISIEMIEAALR